MNEYSGHYDQSFDPRPKCPEPGCELRVSFDGTKYVHLDPPKNLNDRG